MSLQPGTATGPAVNMSGQSSMTDAPAVDATETPVVEAPVEQTADERKYHEAFAKLARKEREIQRQAHEYKQQKARFEQEAKELAEYKSLKERAKADPLALTRHFGLDYKQLTNQILNDDKPTTDMELMTLKEQVEQLKAERQLEIQKQEQANTEKTINAFKSEMVSFLEGQGEKYELIKSFNAYDQVMNTVYEHWKETGEYLQVNEVADQLEAQMEAEARKLLSLKKLSPKQAEQVAEALDAKEGAAPEPQKPFQPAKTLTNQMNTQAPIAKPAALLSEEESKRQAAKLLRWS